MKRKKGVALMLIFGMLLGGCGFDPASSDTLVFGMDGADRREEQSSEAKDPEGQKSVTDAGGSGMSVDEANREILASCAGMTISQTMGNSAGKTIVVDAEVVLDGIDRVSRYRYVPQVYTEEFRKTLLKKEFPAETWDVNEAAAYDSQKAVWEFTTPRGERWMYRVVDSEIAGGQTWTYERLDIEQDFSEGANVTPVLERELTESMELFEQFLELTGGAIPREIESNGRIIIETAADTGDYFCSYLHICEKEGGIPYVKAVFKQSLDGMPVTAWHDFSTATTKFSVFPVKAGGAFYSVEEIGLDKPILSAEEAAAALQKKINSISTEEAQMTVKKISLEYLAVISPEGEPEIVPVWRFWPGGDEKEKCRMCGRILAVNAISGEVIWEERGAYGE